MVQNYQGEAVGQIIGYRLRLDYYRKLQTLSYSWHDRVHSGDLMTRGILDIEGIRLWVNTGILRRLLRTGLIGGGATMVAGEADQMSKTLLVAGKIDRYDPFLGAVDSGASQGAE